MSHCIHPLLKEVASDRATSSLQSNLFHANKNKIGYNLKSAEIRSNSRWDVGGEWETECYILFISLNKFETAY